MSITLVAAVAANGVIGADGGLPWRLPADLRRFKALTLGHTMVMGRRTYDSIGRPLPGRQTVVVTRQADWTVDGVQTAASVPEAIALAGDGEIMVVGGGEIYRQTLDLADRLEITHVDAEVAGDTTFPVIDRTRWEVTRDEPGEGFRFVSYRRTPVRDLDALLADLRPRRRAGEYVYCRVPGALVPDGLAPVVTVTEDEGLTLVLARDGAAAGGFPAEPVLAWIELGVDSALDAVGLTAAVATALAGRGIPANVVAGYTHDHLFVPADRADEALEILGGLGR
ncbi:dihydrofolate reductase [Nakamurella flavida]|uniref:Dihydrofolate reductase n=1 Tax=Nakamurella flavida TaxID=363630 RepID=A0A938YIC4_9ACTN|nr:ACT domain-containing protein [Nakamurella flavida]MBM9475278.1 dihydrofolate reductase [Nakamurella flavida]MDP9776852.1 dihydrofolate reductase [Nakamurella flavida]